MRTFIALAEELGVEKEKVRLLKKRIVDIQERVRLLELENQAFHIEWRKRTGKDIWE
jgi:hypothetical protein